MVHGLLYSVVRFELVMLKLKCGRYEMFSFIEKTHLYSGKDILLLEISIDSFGFTTNSGISKSCVYQKKLDMIPEILIDWVMFQLFSISRDIQLNTWSHDIEILFGLILELIATHQTRISMLCVLRNMTFMDHSFLSSLDIL